MEQQKSNRRIPTVVIGGGQAGLATGYHLAQRGLPFIILDAHNRVGEAWRKRWDSLRTFTPARFSSLPGMAFPGRLDLCPTKDEVADYLESYAAHFHLPVRVNSKVLRVWRDGQHFSVETGTDIWQADNVIVAMANFQQPRVPDFAAQLHPAITQLHSHHYRNASQLQPGDVLVVGAGNSGADIAMDVAKTHKTWMAGKESGHIPVRIDTFFARHIFFRFIRFVGHHVLTLATPIGRKNRPKLLTQTTPLVRVKPQNLVDAGVQRVPRVIATKNGKPLLQDGRSLDVQNVLWCTGYLPGFSWIDLPVFDETGLPRQHRGAVAEAPGLYFVGLHFQYAMSSATLLGVGRDAKWVVRALESQERRRATVPVPARAPREAYS
jgi:putative flavoprotein involved in K+ transport